MAGKIKQETQTWRQWEAEEWEGCLHAWGVHVCGVCALGGARALAAPLFISRLAGELGEGEEADRRQCNSSNSR